MHAMHCNSLRMLTDCRIHHRYKQAAGGLAQIQALTPVCAAPCCVAVLCIAVLCCAVLSRAEVGDVDTVKSLLQSGTVDINAQLPHSRSTPLHLACKAGHADVAQLLVEAGADVNAATGAYTAICQPSFVTFNTCAADETS
jgi:hypothetical protein